MTLEVHTSPEVHTYIHPLLILISYDVLAVSVCALDFTPSLCVAVRVTVWSLLPPGLAAQHAHTGNVDAYEPPRHQVFEGRQSAHKRV